MLAVAGCQHEPRCLNRYDCIGKLVMQRRLDEHAGMVTQARAAGGSTSSGGDG